MRPTCPICGGLWGLANKNPDIATSDAFVEGFMLGIITERAAHFNERNVSSLVCVEHLKRLRALADLIPLEIVGPTHRHLLNLGLEVVKT